MEKDVSEKTVSEEKDTIKIATIAAVAKAIKDSAEYRQFSYYGEEDYAQMHACLTEGFELILSHFVSFVQLHT